jgi:hypothetical protein
MKVTLLRAAALGARRFSDGKAMGFEIAGTNDHGRFS